MQAIGWTDVTAFGDGHGYVMLRGDTHQSHAFTPQKPPMQTVGLWEPELLELLVGWGAVMPSSLSASHRR